jgi:eukaryotic-like serine/threonine-protein kinase
MMPPSLSPDPKALMSTRVFLSYSQKDEALCQEFVVHLDVLQENGTLTAWHARKVGPGEDQRAAIDREMEAADIVLLLASADFLSSEYGRGAEVRRAVERHKEGAARVVPVVLRPCLWEEAAFGHLSPLPSGGQPVTRWPDRDEAWLDVARGLRALAQGGLLPAKRARTHSAPAPRTGSNRAAAISVARPEIEQWLRQLEAAQAAKDAASRRGKDTGPIQATIDDCKRRLREGGQLHANDSLGGGRYFLLRLLGRGGFATVWEADDREAGQRVAVKVLHPHCAADPARRERFFRGARAMAKLRHPHVVRVLVPYEEDAGFFYFVMELLSGGDLHRAVIEKRVTRTSIVPMIFDVGGALAEAHAQGFVHRDVSPHNILLGASGEAKLSDFDLVAAAGSTGGTRTGAMGKFVYAAPEGMSHPQDADGRADVFSLGMTTIFCLHGADLPTHVLRKPEHLLTRLDCGALAPVLQKAIEWEAEGRYPTAQAFCEALRAASREPAQQPVAPLVAFRPPVLGRAPLPETLREPRLVMVPLPGGKFWMGSRDDDPQARPDEKPRHRVRVKGFKMASTVVTQAQYEAVMGNNPCYQKAPDLPVTNVSWIDAINFCNTLSDHQGLPRAYLLKGDEVTWVKDATGYRLPSEAEWEYAARAGTDTAWSFGDDERLLADHGWFAENSGKRLNPVGRRKPNPWGLFDMHGNVWEWCWDIYGPYARLPSGGHVRVLRGGSFIDVPALVRSALRDWVSPAARRRYIGFRCTLSVVRPSWSSI